MSDASIVIVGAGPAGLIAAERLAANGFRVQVYDQNNAAARKFLVAGHGGFNLTHSEDTEVFVGRYDCMEIRNIVRGFDNTATVAWFESIGIHTFVGSSGKVFPIAGIKPIQVLQAILVRLTNLGVQFHYGYQLVDFDEQRVTFAHQGKLEHVVYRKLILGLGGGSWPKTGSDAKWVDLFYRKGIPIEPLAAANSGLHTKSDFSDLAGQVLKNLVLKLGMQSKAGELVFTSYGVEGAPVYYMNRFLRDNPFPARLLLDLKPTYTVDAIERELEGSRNTTSALRSKLKLSSTAVQLLKRLDKDIYTHTGRLAATIKNFPLEVTSFRPIEEVISTAGGVPFSVLSDTLALRRFPDVHCVGEMLDWEAPTGGYLLQACFSSGVWVADRINNRS